MNIPNKLECAYCKRNFTHGGECQSPMNSDRGCLAFKLDPQGCIRRGHSRISIPVFSSIPAIGEWNDNYQLSGMDTRIKIVKIIGLEWNQRKGTLIVICEFDYYINEYSENYRKPTKLKLVQGEKQSE